MIANHILVLLLVAICITWLIVEKMEQEDMEIEEQERLEKERFDRLTDNVRAYARRHKRIDFIIGE